MDGGQGPGVPALRPPPPRPAAGAGEGGAVGPEDPTLSGSYLLGGHLDYPRFPEAYSRARSQRLRQLAAAQHLSPQTLQRI